MSRFRSSIYIGIILFNLSLIGCGPEDVKTPPAEEPRVEAPRQKLPPPSLPKAPAPVPAPPEPATVAKGFFQKLWDGLKYTWNQPKAAGQAALDYAKTLPQIAQEHAEAFQNDPRGYVENMPWDEALKNGTVIVASADVIAQVAKAFAQRDMAAVASLLKSALPPGANLVNELEITDLSQVLDTSRFNDEQPEALTWRQWIRNKSDTLSKKCELIGNFCQRKPQEAAVYAGAKTIQYGATVLVSYQVFQAIMTGDVSTLSWTTAPLALSWVASGTRYSKWVNRLTRASYIGGKFASFFRRTPVQAESRVALKYTNIDQCPIDQRPADTVREVDIEKVIPPQLPANTPEIQAQRWFWQRLAERFTGGAPHASNAVALQPTPIDLEAHYGECAAPVDAESGICAAPIPVENTAPVALPASIDLENYYGECAVPTVVETADIGMCAPEVPVAADVPVAAETLVCAPDADVCALGEAPAEQISKPSKLSQFFKNYISKFSPSLGIGEYLQHIKGSNKKGE